MAFISVQSDGVKSGEDIKMDVSKGLNAIPTTAGDKMQFVFLTMQKNHRELIGLVGLLETRIKNLEDQVLQSTLAVIKKVEGCEEAVERAIQGIDLVIQFEEQRSRPSLWTRIWTAIFGTEKK